MLYEGSDMQDNLRQRRKTAKNYYSETCTIVILQRGIWTPVKHMVTEIIYRYRV